jgi:hypothetical protein
MKKIALALSTLVVVGGMMFFTACTETDTTKPVITITNDDATHNVVTQFSAASYTDPGATATDDKDGVLTCTVSGAVNMNLAGEYILTYTATDGEGNSSTAERTVTVDGAKYIGSFTYTATDYPDGLPVGTPWQEHITASSITNNKINFERFADYDTGIAYGTISGTTITIPSQMVTCGSTGNVANRQFTGSGTFTNGFTQFTINYTEVTNGTTSTGHTIYVRN